MPIQMMVDCGEREEAEAHHQAEDHQVRTPSAEPAARIRRIAGRLGSAGEEDDW